MERTIGFKERRYIEELRILTKSTAIDCLMDERFDRIIYVVRPGDMGLAIGKKGENIRRMQKVLGKKIEMVEYSENPDEFIANMFRPAVLSSVRKDESGRVSIILEKTGRSRPRHREGGGERGEGPSPLPEVLRVRARGDPLHG